MPGKLPQDNTGVLAGLPPATLAGYRDYPIPIKKSPYENFKPKHAAPWKVIHIGNFVGNDWHVVQIAQFDKTASAMRAAGMISDFSQVHADASVPVQIQQMRTAIQQGYDAIILEPNSESALTRSSTRHLRPASSALFRIPLPIASTLSTLAATPCSTVEPRPKSWLPAWAAKERC